MPMNKCEQPLLRAKYEQLPLDDEPDEKFVTVSFVRQIYVYLNDLSAAKCLSSQTRAVLKAFLCG